MSHRAPQNKTVTLGGVRLPYYTVFFVAVFVFNVAGCASDPKPPPAWAVAADAKTSYPSDSSLIDRLADSIDSLPEDDSGFGKSSLANESILISWATIDGGVEGNRLAGFTRQYLKNPVATAARGKYIYIVEGADKEVYLYDNDLDRLQLIPGISKHIKHEISDIYVAPDLSFYLTDSSAGRVLQFSKSGKLLQIFENYLNMSRPVGVTVDEHRGFVLIADGSYDYVLVFDRQGVLLDAIGARGERPGEFRALSAIALGNEGVFITSRIGKRAQVVNLDSRFRYAFEENTLVFPTAIVVDEDNQAFVSDSFDNTIKIFRKGELVSTFGGTGSGPGRFNKITDMWLDEGFLYVTDSLNRRIQILRIVPEGLLEPLAE